MIEVHFAQVSRYERGETKPNAQAIAKLAQVLDTTADYLMNGNSNDQLNQIALDKEIINRFKQIQELDATEKKIVLSLLDAYIAKHKIQHILGMQK